MEVASERNPTIPDGPLIPRNLPALNSAARSEALKRSFAQRARAFSCCWILLLLPAIGRQAELGLSWADGKAVVLALAFGLFLRIVTLKETDLELQRWGSFSCLFIGLSFAYVAYPQSRAAAEELLDPLLLGMVLSGCFFLLKRWLLPNLILFSGLYSIITWQFIPEETGPAWLKLAIAWALSLLAYRTQMRLCADYNNVMLTDEARLALYQTAAEKAHNAQHRFERLSNAGREALILHRAGKILDANHLALEAIGLSRENVLGQDLTKLLGRNCTRVITQRFDPTNHSLVALKLVRQNGTTVNALAFNHEIVFPDGPVAVLGLRLEELKDDQPALPTRLSDVIMN